MKTFPLPTGAQLPQFGIGTWGMGERSSQQQTEVDAVRFALDQGITLIDSAEMYGNGGAEEVVGKAIQGRRDEVFIVSKVYPHNASMDAAIAACERSLRRLGTDTIDLYLLHWRGGIALYDTLTAFERLRVDGKIRDFGVSNFDRDDLTELDPLDNGQCATNQVLYNLARREAEWAVLPWCRKRPMPVMAYCPLDQAGALLDAPALHSVAEHHSATTAQIALAWLLRQEGVVAIPKSIHPQRIRENVAALQLQLSNDDVAILDRAFPAPDQPARLGIV